MQNELDEHISTAVCNADVQNNMMLCFTQSGWYKGMQTSTKYLCRLVDDD